MTAETRPGAQPGETVCEGCIHGPPCRVIPCASCGKSWHLLGGISNPFLCPRCEDAGVVIPPPSAVQCWCRPGSPDLPVASPHDKNDRCSHMNYPPGQEVSQ